MNSTSNFSKSIYLDNSISNLSHNNNGENEDIFTLRERTLSPNLNNSKRLDSNNINDENKQINSITNNVIYLKAVKKFTKFY